MRKKVDALATSTIKTFGVLVIFAVVFMLLLILKEALPLFFPSSISPIHDPISIKTEKSEAVLAVGMGEYKKNAFVVLDSGKVTFYDLETGKIRSSQTLRSDNTTKITYLEQRAGGFFSLLYADGVAQALRIKYDISFDKEQTRHLKPVAQVLATLKSTQGAPLKSLVRAKSDEVYTRLDTFADGKLFITQSKEAEGFLATEAEVSSKELLPAGSPATTAIALTNDGAKAYVANKSGALLEWRMRDSIPDKPTRITRQSAEIITAMGFVFGDVSLVTGDAAGNMYTWFHVRDEQSGKQTLTRVKELEKHDTAVSYINGTVRNKVIISRSTDGKLLMDLTTNERHLFSLAGPMDHIALNNRAQAIIGLTRAGELRVWDLHYPHPEASWGALFGNIWYESFPEPTMTWQSSSGSDDYEAKMSLVPLIYGSIKGTFYAMIFAVPLALLGAVYTSQFTTPGIKRVVKPTVEIMAAVPSVVIGFLAAQWFADILEGAVVMFFMLIIALPIGLVLCPVGWNFIKDTAFAKSIPKGYEFLLITPIMILVVMVCGQAAPAIEASFFGGNFQQWLYDSSGEQYNQLNSIVIAFALGFTVIPIIFTMSEDALSNVPRALKAGALALGGSRWQTVARVILPSASPGIFAGCIIGFGRAVGETMIVLFATGNTPIISASPFNGMRTLSANIAVEIPEAPHGESLYRILFLSAVILFLMTSVLNTCAEIIRHKLRKKYGQFQ